MTRSDQNLEKLVQIRNILWQEPRPIWNRLSSVYAKGASGTAHFFLSAEVSPGSIWLKTEKPILLKNGVKIITH